MATVPLTRGLVALVDDDDFERVAAFKWMARPADQSIVRYYACRTAEGGGYRRTVYLHRFILDAQPGVLVDHINGDGLDNRRSNIRLCSPQQNVINRAYASASGFRGVHHLRRGGRWQAQIEVDGRPYRCGPFQSAELAARAYDALAREFQGEFAVLNFPDIKGRAA